MAPRLIRRSPVMITREARGMTHISVPISVKKKAVMAIEGITGVPVTAAGYYTLAHHEHEMVKQELAARGISFKTASSKDATPEDHVLVAVKHS